MTSERKQHLVRLLGQELTFDEVMAMSQDTSTQDIQEVLLTVWALKLNAKSQEAEEARFDAWDQEQEEARS